MNSLLLFAVPLILPSYVPADVTEGTFRAWNEATPAVTYDTTAVPEGATAKVTVTDEKTGVSVRLKVTGLVPGRAYGAHLHVNPCTDKPADAGPHFQHRIDPVQPSVDPEYANPRNEIWLDFTADADGNARAASKQSWHFDVDRQPWSLVLHAERTHTAPGEAGMAGARLACLTRTAVSAYGNGGGRL
ncbi:superoxide dismutase family protein [Actinoplanes sp. NBC_00393]|uniref:superoxide dismutase family protein n=1 Tax=Actinoplanes sp. NBC_00393 TaxID=2975953 RepID=UPI002E21667F